MKRLLLFFIFGLTLTICPKTRDDSKITDYVHPRLKQQYKNCSTYGAMAKVVASSALKNAFEITKKNADIDFYQRDNIAVFHCMASADLILCGLAEGCFVAGIIAAAAYWVPYVSQLSIKNIASCLVDEATVLDDPTLSNISLQNSFLAAYGD